MFCALHEHVLLECPCILRRFRNGHFKYYKYYYHYFLKLLSELNVLGTAFEPLHPTSSQQAAVDFMSLMIFLYQQ